MYSPRLYKYRDSCTVYTYSTRLRFTLLGTDTHTWRFRPLLSDCRLQSLDLSIKVHFKLQLLDLNLSSPNIFVTDGINLSYFKLNFFYRTEFKVWNISGLIHLFVKKKSLRQKKNPSPVSNINVSNINVSNINVSNINVLKMHVFYFILACNVFCMPALDSTLSISTCI